MKILYLGYWGAHEGLSVSTIYPHLEVLAAYPNIHKIIYCSIEREEPVQAFNSSLPKVQHVPLHSPRGSHVLMNKTRDFTVFPRQISAIIRQENIDLMICRAAPAGIIGYLVHRLTKIPYWVESFEPHAAYMAEAGVWKRWDPRYLIEKLGERLQLKSAKIIMPVTRGYRNLLIAKGEVPERLITLPCTVDIDKFKSCPEYRIEFRRYLNIPEVSTCGIYVGKFGGLYFDEESFDVFKTAKEVFNNFYLLILSPQPKKEIEAKLLSVGFSYTDFYVTTVPHQEVPNYLKAADFAFANIKPINSQQYSSAIKLGEYWAAGLPVLLSEGVGDESEIIASGEGGVVFTLANTREALIKMKRLIQNPSRLEYTTLAEKYRGRALIKRAYDEAFAKAFPSPG